MVWGLVFGSPSDLPPSSAASSPPVLPSAPEASPKDCFASAWRQTAAPKALTTDAEKMKRRRGRRGEEEEERKCKGRLSASVSPYGLMLGRRRFFVTQGLKGKQLLCPMLSLASHVSIAVSTGTSEGGNDEGSRLAAHWTGNECSRIKSLL